MKPGVPNSPSEDLSDTQDLLGLAYDDDSGDILEAANHAQLSERRGEGREAQQKVDADFFNRFDDDADESDMRPSA